MKITSVKSDFFKFDDRRFKFQRREVSEAYKKASTFVDASRNPTIKMIKNLLLAEVYSPEDLSNLTQKNISDIKQAELEVASDRGFHDDDFEWFLRDNNRRVVGEKTVFRKEFHNSFFNSAYEKAISNYTYQMKMAEPGFTLTHSQYSLIV